MAKRKQSPRMGYLKLTRAGLESVWFQRATVKGKQFANKAAGHGMTKTVNELWDAMNWSGEGMVTVGPRPAEAFLRWARTVDGWRDGYAVWEPTGESRL